MNLKEVGGADLHLADLHLEIFFMTNAQCKHVLLPMIAIAYCEAST